MSTEYLHKSQLICLFIIIFFYTGLSLKPNILLILADDMGNADASFNFRITNPTLTSPPIITPNIDYLANNGIIFTNHYTQPICGPSRCALLTSRYSYRLGNPFPYVSGNNKYDLQNIGAGDLGAKYQTFVHELSYRGYKNHFIGKYGVDNHDRYYENDIIGWLPKIDTKTNNISHHKLGPLSRGFDTFYGLYSSAHNHFTKRIGGNVDWHKFNETHILEYPELDNEPDISSTHIFTRETINIIKNNKNINSDKPFFIHLSYTMPHDPLQVDDTYLNINNKYCMKSPNYRRRIYCAMIACVDEGIGNITTYLKQNNLLKNTIIIFSSDNGGFPFNGGYNYPYKGNKGSIFTGGVKTPAFIYSPQLFIKTSGSLYNGLIHLIDWGPTLLSLADNYDNNDQSKHLTLTHKMGEIDGMDLSYSLIHFNDKSFDTLSYLRNELILDSNGWTNSSAYIVGEYKLVLGYAGGDFIWMEPDDDFTMNSKYREPRLKIPDYVNGFIRNVFGIDCFNYEVAVIGFGGRMTDYVRDEMNSPLCRHPDGLPKSPKDRRALYIPSINWNDKYEKQKIRLYNLKLDPTESNNIAFDNKDIVESMINKLRKKLIDEKDELGLDVTGALHHNLLQWFKTILLFVFVAWIGLLLLICCLCRYCCKRNKAKLD